MAKRCNNQSLNGYKSMYQSFSFSCKKLPNHVAQVEECRFAQGIK